MDNRWLEKRTWSWLLMQYSDDRARICHNPHESMEPSCLASTVQAGGFEKVRRIYSLHTLGHLVQTEHNLNTTAYFTAAAGHVHPFTIVYV